MGLKKYITDKAKDYWASQWVDWSGVRPECKFDQRKKEFIMVSPAGILKFRPKTVRDLTRFRNTYINFFETIKTQEGFFNLYRDIKRKYKVSHSRNLSIRLKGLRCF